MKKIFFLLLVSCTGILASAQKVYFIYLQTDDQSPFYVRMKEKVFSSATSGFLILPNLTDSTYTLNIGFANSTGPEAKFSIPIRQNDKGYTIKKLDNELALFDFVETSLIKANAIPKDNTVYETKSDNFSSVLSKAAGDPSIVKVPVKKEEAPKEKPEQKIEAAVKTEEVKPLAKTVVDAVAGSKADSVVVVNSKTQNPPVKTELKTDTITTQPLAKETSPVQQPVVSKEETPVQEVPYKPTSISRHSESSTTEGFGVVYFDKLPEGTDTIRILIPSSKFNIAATTSDGPPAETPSKLETVDTLSMIKKSEAGIKTEKIIPSGKTESFTACKNAASEKDFMKLRKKMAAKENDDEMIEEAKKEFRNKCYTVEQIRYLSTLFLTSAAKYQFFDSAYQHASDQANFSGLQSEIKDEYYLKRFKALIGE